MIVTHFDILDSYVYLVFFSKENRTIPESSSELDSVISITDGVYVIKTPAILSMDNSLR